MAWLKKLLGRDDRFFNLLEASAEEGRASVRLVARLLRQPGQLDPLDEVHQARRRDKEIHEVISAHVARTFVSALDREDVETLSVVLHRIPKTAEKIAGRFSLCHAELADVDFAPYAEVLERGADHVWARVAELRQMGNIDRIEEQNAELSRLEDEANGWLLRLIQHVHARPREIPQLVVLRDLCRFLERLMDRYVEVSEVVTQIVLKNT